MPASAAPTPDPGSPETEEVPAVAEEIPAALPADLSVPAASEVVEPLIPGPALLQQVTQGVVSEEQAQPGYSSGITAPVDTAGQPLVQALTSVVDTSTAAAASAVEGLLGTVGQWVSDAASSGEDGPSSTGGRLIPEPLAPLNPVPLGGNEYVLFSGMGQVNAGGAGATMLLGVLVLASVVLLRRDVRTYLISCEVAKPSSALLSPLERPG